MRTAIITLTLVVFMVGQTACSIYKAATQPPPADLSGIGIGTPRQEVIMRVGAPKFSDTDAEGKKQDSYEFFSGLHGVSKARIILYLAADVFTLALAELILWPLELTLMEKATCNAFGTYDLLLKIETWRVGQKDGVQGC